MSKVYMWQDWPTDDLIGYRYELDEEITFAHGIDKLEPLYDEWNALNRLIDERENGK